MTINEFLNGIQDYYGNYDEKLLAYVSAFLKEEIPKKGLKDLKRYTFRHHPQKSGPPDIAALSKAWFFRKQQYEIEYPNTDERIEDPRRPEHQPIVNEILQAVPWPRNQEDTCPESSR